MRNKLLIAVTAFIAITAIATGTAKANPLEIELTKTTDTLSLIQPKEEPKIEETNIETEHIVSPGETLDSISKLHTTTWKRIWDKNPNITNPDVIKPGDKLIIARPEEVLADRPLPTTVVTTPTGSSTVYVRSSSSGNMYSPGYCTWYVKNMRPDIPNNLGNADTWYMRGISQGLPGGTEPRIGAIGVAKSYMHVVIVTGVSGDLVTVSEMNYSGLYVVSSRITNASEFNYLY